MSNTYDRNFDRPSFQHLLQTYDLFFGKILFLHESLMYINKKSGILMKVDVAVRQESKVLSIALNRNHQSTVSWL
jgi:hypothetical protein